MDKKKILIIDDDLEILELIKTALESPDYEIITKTNGKMTLEYLEKETPNLIIGLCT